MPGPTDIERRVAELERRMTALDGEGAIPQAAKKCPHCSRVFFFDTEGTEPMRCKRCKKGMPALGGNEIEDEEGDEEEGEGEAEEAKLVGADAQ